MHDNGGYHQEVVKAINRISSTIHPAPIWRMMGRF
jgi:hypothetical protein